MVEAVAINPMRFVAMASAASVVIGSSQLKGVVWTSFHSPRTSARKIELNRPASAFWVISTLYRISVSGRCDDLGCRHGGLVVATALDKKIEVHDPFHTAPFGVLAPSCDNRIVAFRD